MPFEKLLILHCAPTLASLKMANLFSFPYTDAAELEKQIQYWNSQMNEKGVCLNIMRKKNNKALIYVYRTSAVKTILNTPQIQDFLKTYGYRTFAIAQVLEFLQNRLVSQKDFPHEIGIFLGYPLKDVSGFIYHGGKDFLYSGLWKVYENPEETKKLFQKYKKCTDIYVRVWKNGRSIQQMTVAA